MMLPISIDNRQRLGFAMMIRVLGLATTAQFTKIKYKKHAIIYKLLLLNVICYVITCTIQDEVCLDRVPVRFFEKGEEKKYFVLTTFESYGWVTG